MTTSDPNQSALNILQNTPHGDHDQETEILLEAAAFDIATYHSPTGDQAARHGYLSQALKNFLLSIVHNCPPGADRSRAIAAAREAKHWASAAVALENS